MPIRSPASGKGQATDQSRGPRRRASCWQLYCSDNNSLTRSSFHICTRFPASAICPTDAMVWQRAVARNGPPGHLTASGRLPSRRQIQQWQKNIPKRCRGYPPSPRRSLLSGSLVFWGDKKPLPRPFCRCKGTNLPGIGPRSGKEML